MFILANKYLLLVPIIILSLASCREEIIPPFTPSGKINEPVQQSTPDSYTFTINAQSISDSLVDHTFLKFTRFRLYLSLFDYLSGAAELTIYDRNRSIIYRSTLNKNFQNPSFGLDGYVPDVVQIYFSNFTGKLTVQILPEIN